MLCDRRIDINRVALAAVHVQQWACDGEAIARFVLVRLGLRRSLQGADASGTSPLGLAAGDTRHEMLSLRTHEEVVLVVADTAEPLADLIDFARGAYTLDAAAIRHLVDAATTADPRYPPSMARRQARRQKAYRALKKGGARRCPTCGTPGRLPVRRPVATPTPAANT